MSVCVCVDSSVLKARGCSALGGKGARRLQHASGSTANLKKSSIPKHPACSAQEPNGGLRVSTCKALLLCDQLPFQKLVLSLSSSAAQATREAKAFLMRPATENVPTDTCRDKDLCEGQLAPSLRPLSSQ